MYLWVGEWVCLAAFCLPSDARLPPPPDAGPFSLDAKLLGPPMENTIYCLSSLHETFRLGEIEIKCGDEPDYTVWDMTADGHTEPFYHNQNYRQYITGLSKSMVSYWMLR